MTIAAGMTIGAETTIAAEMMIAAEAGDGDRHGLGVVAETEEGHQG
jgi:hypothetical protein